MFCAEHKKRHPTSSENCGVKFYMKKLIVIVISIVIFSVLAVLVARLTAPNSFFTLHDIAPSVFGADLNLIKSIIEKSKIENGYYPENLDGIMPEQGLSLSKGFCNNNLRYKYPGTHSSDGYDLWFEPCERLKTESISNW